MRLICSILGILAFSAAHSHAQDSYYLPDVETATPMDEAELTKVFTDQTHRGTYNFSRKNIDTFSFSETTTSDNLTHHVQGDRVDTGSWSIYKNRICFSYDTLDFSGSCFHIYKVGNCYYHYSLRPRVGAKGRFTARSVLKGEIPSCEPSFS